jgi:hypothetical protein
MHRTASDSGGGALGYVRQRMPNKANEGSRGRYYMTPPTDLAKIPERCEPGGKAKAPAMEVAKSRESVGRMNETLNKPGEAAGRPAQETANTANQSVELGMGAEMQEAVAMLRKTDTALTEGAERMEQRVDQLALKLSVMDNTVKTMEKAIASLREELSSMARSTGGQSSEKTEALGRQLSTLEDSFCEHSARADRERGQMQTALDRLLSSSEDDVSKCEKIELNARLQALEEGQGVGSMEIIKDELQRWLSSEALPDLKRTLSKLDRSDVTQAAAMAAYEKLDERLEQQMQAQSSSLQEMMQRYAFPLHATVLRPTHGRDALATLQLHHPITRMGDTTYMHSVRPGSNGAVEVELFPVEDAEGPFVAFTPAPAATSQ